ncbi:MAG: sugar-binding protein [Cytophagales bacterium]|nr:sugar-binding protein [Cytophagales bacterium]
MRCYLSICFILFTCKIYSQLYTYAIYSENITIDGKLNETDWKLTNKVEKLINIGNANTNISNTVTFGVLWDKSYLYVAVKVIDATVVDAVIKPGTSCSSSPLLDAIEIFIDPRYNKKRITNDNGGLHFKAFPNDENFCEDFGNGKGAISKVVKDNTGYTAEFAFPWTMLDRDTTLKPIPGRSLGMDVANDDTDNTTATARDVQAMWNNCCVNENWQTTAKYGQVILCGIPDTIKGIDGMNFICTVPSSVVYTLPGLIGISYGWSVTGTTDYKKNNATLTVNWAQNGEYSMTIHVANTCGASTVLQKNITVGVNTGIKAIGPNVVCPYAKNVKYEFVVNDGYRYSFGVRGGSGSLPIAEKAPYYIDWRGYSDSAKITMVPWKLTDEGIQCFGKTEYYPVKIDTNLRPLGPYGASYFCRNDSSYHTYSTIETNGSKYKWLCQGCTFEKTDTGNTARLKWVQSQNAKLWLYETYTSPANVCKGYSDTLEIISYPLPDSVYFFPSYTNTAATSATLSLTSSFNNADFINIYKKNSKETAFTLLEKYKYNGTNLYIDRVADGNNHFFQYKIIKNDSCNLSSESDVMNTIFLQMKTNSKNNFILHWNPYYYNKDVYYQLYTTIESSATNVNTDPIYDTLYTKFTPQNGIIQTYFVACFEKYTQKLLSISNITNIRFDIDIQAINIITPNSDGQNDTWRISNIELYPYRAVNIFNRWGTNVYKSELYANDFDAQALPDGLYYYDLKYGLSGYDNKLSGWINIIR